MANLSAVAELSAGRWRELYWCDDLPSTNTLASKFGVSQETIRRYLKLHGIPIRTISQQAKADYKLGRRESPAKGGTWARNPKGEHPRWLAAMTKRQLKTRAKNSVAAKEKRTAVEPCEWCAEPVERHYSRTRGVSFLCCNSSCRGKICALRKHRGIDAPRPLIVEKLKALTEERYARINVRSERSVAKTIRLPVTPEQLAKVAPEIGARQPEIDAVLDLAIEEHLAANQGGDTI